MSLLGTIISNYGTISMAVPLPEALLGGLLKELGLNTTEEVGEAPSILVTSGIRYGIG